MLLTLLGLFLLAFPFLLINRFPNKLLGFVYILVGTITFYLLLAIVTQALHLFTYPVIFGVTAIACIIVAFKIDYKGWRTQTKQVTSIKKLDWWLIATLATTVFCLSSVHYNYTGKISVATDRNYQQTENLQYSYPYYSDEWYAVAFVNQAIETRSLPFTHPFKPDQTFINYEFVSHALIAELSLLLQLNPLQDYTKLTVGFNTLIILLLYLFLRYIAVSPGVASVAALGTLLITSGANLPGIWNLIPLTTGILTLLLSLFFYEGKNVPLILFTSFITLLFYPPLVVFIAPAFLCFVLTHRSTIKQKVPLLILSSLVVMGVAAAMVSLSFLVADRSLPEIGAHIISKLSYTSFTDLGVPNYKFWYVLPWPILALTIFAFFSRFQQQHRGWLKIMLAIGTIFWFLYFYTNQRFVIEFQRVVFATAVLFIIFGGIGLQRLFDICTKKRETATSVQITVLLLIIVFCFNYTSREQWQKMTLNYTETDTVLLPSAPANTYLTEDDLNIFANIQNEYFLSLPWKGTVIGVATNNYPRSVKNGTVGVRKNLYNKFMSSDCKQKSVLAKNTTYIYTPKFDCENFTLLTVSKEGLHLYEHTRNGG